MAAGLTACGGGGTDARISGHFIGAAGREVYLERVVPGVASPATDTVVTDDNGEFAFRVALPDGQPAIFNLRYEGDMVPLLVSPREEVNVMSLGDLDGYRVGGSPESELVWQLHGIMSGGAATLDSIWSLYTLTPEGPERLQHRRSYYDEYLRVKRRQISFIVENASSLAAVYALYQRLPGDNELFSGDNDHVYYQMVADSVSARYPDSRYVQALRREVETLTASHDLADRINNEGIALIDYPEIELPDMYGQNVKLSSLAGSVIVLDFWSAESAAGRQNNAEMKELWGEFADRGLAIYQVSVDTSRPLWVNAVQEQRLPWATVCDFRGEATAAVRTYNIASLPSNFVIDRAGNIVGTNLYGEALRAKIEELI
jgi:peroxiredoxin